MSFDDPPADVDLSLAEVDALIDQFDEEFPEYAGLLRASVVPVEGSE